MERSLHVAGVITASEPHWIALFSGLQPRDFRRLIATLRREGAELTRRGRPWSLSLEDRVLLVTAYWRTNLTLRQLAPLFGMSKSAADRIVDHVGPLLAFKQRQRFRAGTVLIVDGTLVPTRDHSVAEQSKNYRYSTSHQVVIDADTRMVVVVGRPVPGNRNDRKAWAESGAKAAVGKTTTIADGGYGHRAGHPASPSRGRRTVRLEAGAQPLSQAGQSTRRARLRSVEDLENPSRLPPEGRRRPPRHARHSQAAQSRPHWRSWLRLTVKVFCPSSVATLSGEVETVTISSPTAPTPTPWTTHATVTSTG